MELKEVTVKVYAKVLISGINSTDIHKGNGFYVRDREYFRRICKNLVGIRYLGDCRYKLIYEV